MMRMALTTLQIGLNRGKVQILVCKHQLQCQTMKLKVHQKVHNLYVGFLAFLLIHTLIFSM